MIKIIGFHLIILLFGLAYTVPASAGDLLIKNAPLIDGIITTCRAVGDTETSAAKDQIAAIRLL
jgi:hypothetical protein